MPRFVPLTRLRPLLGIALAALLQVSWAAQGRAAQAAVLPHLDDVVSTQSVFLDEPNFGKDPFFPKSDRRKPVIVTPVNAAPDASFYAQAFNSIVLRGISGLPGHRLALLNNRTVGVGEDTDVRFNNQILHVRCLEIRDKTVLLGIEGTKETKEIHLRAGF